MSSRHRSAIVVGASAGIGRSAALAFAARGMHVVALARDAERLRQLEFASGDLAGRVTAMPCDAADAPRLVTVLERAFDKLENCDVVLHTAGSAMPVGAIWECDAVEAASSIATLVGSAWVTASVGIRHMLAGGGGLVLLASSGAAQKTAVGRSMYSSSKAAVDQLVRVVGAEIAAAAPSAAIAGFYPGMVDTAMQANLARLARLHAHGPFAAEFGEVSAAAGQGLVSPEDVATSICQLLECHLSTLNGQVLKLRSGNWVVDR
jgi:NAD(P)-dependent dehydrogenase (short-subunit alcohol dehydrogenase family)